MIDVEIGPRLRAARRAAGISGRGLAAEIGVSGALVSQIETGRTQPSVTTLYAIVERLGISLDWLIGLTAAGQPPEEPADQAVELAQPIRRADTHPVLQIADGVRWELVSSAAEGAAEGMLVTYEPGASSSPDFSPTQHEGVESAYLFEGSLIVQLDSEEFEITAGDSLVFDSRRPHLYRNTTSSRARGIWISTGGSHLPS